MLKIILTGVILSLVPLFPLLAQDGSLRLITSPLPINLVATPGETVAAELRVKNDGAEEEHLTVHVMKFSAYETSGKPRLIESEATDHFLQWATLSEPSFTLSPNEWKTVTVNFSIPPEAAFGYYYAFVFSRATPKTELVPNQTRLIGGAATLVLLEVKVPEARREIALIGFTTDNKIYEFLPVQYSVSIKNTGNVHVAPRGNIFIDQGETHDLALLEVNREKGNILPNSTRIFEAAWQDGFPVYQEKVVDGQVVLDAQGIPETELAWSWNSLSKIRFGKYTAKLLLVYDDGTRDIPVEGEVSFWVVPWRLIGGGIFISLFFVIGIRSTLMKLWHRFFPCPSQV